MPASTFKFWGLPCVTNHGYVQVTSHAPIVQWEIVAPVTGAKVLCEKIIEISHALPKQTNKQTNTMEKPYPFAASSKLLDFYFR